MSSSPPSRFEPGHRHVCDFPARPWSRSAPLIVSAVTALIKRPQPLTTPVDSTQIDSTRFGSMRLASLWCRVIGVCVIVSAAYSVWPTLRLARALFPITSLFPFLFASLVTWTLLVVGGLGLLKCRPWAFVLIYIAAGLNYFPGFSFIPFADRAAMLFLPVHGAQLLATVGVNLLVVMLLIRIHLNRGAPRH